MLTFFFRTKSCELLPCARPHDMCWKTRKFAGNASLNGVVLNSAFITMAVNDLKQLLEVKRYGCCHNFKDGTKEITNQ